MRLAFVYMSGIVVPVLIMLVILGFPFQALYEDLILFNRNYSGIARSSSIYGFVYKFAGRTRTVVYAFIKYSYIPFGICVSYVFICIYYFSRKYTIGNIIRLVINRWTMGIVTGLMLIGLPSLISHKSTFPVILERYSYKAFVLVILYVFTLLCSLLITIYYSNITEKFWKSFNEERNDILPLWDSQFTWTIVYLFAELFMVVLQGTGGKPYPLFPSFIPLSLLASLSLTSLLSSKTPLRLPSAAHESRFIVTAFLILILVLGYHRSMYENIEQIAKVDPAEQIIKMLKGLMNDDITSVNSWPEAKLIAEIKKHAKGSADLFTIDFQGYIYLETDKIPPIQISNYYEPLKCNMWGMKKEVEQQLWESLESRPPIAITTRKDHVPEAAIRLLSKYRKVGTYPTSYCEYTDLYIYSTPNPLKE